MAGDNTVWKEFEENPITHSAAHYLMTIFNLLEDQGYARVTDIARRLNITRGSCSISLRPLKKRGLVVEDQNRFLKLSDEGRNIARMVELNDELLELLFKEILGVDEDQAEIDACKIEHLISIETSLALSRFIRLWQSNHTAAENFKKALREESPCEHNVENCAICKDTCIENINFPPKDA